MHDMSHLLLQIQALGANPEVLANLWPERRAVTCHKWLTEVVAFFSLKLRPSAMHSFLHTEHCV